MLSDAQQTMDARLRAAVIAAISTDQGPVLPGLKVGVLNGIVHLAGEVTSLDLWHTIERIAAETPGVRGVVNRITAPGAPPPSRKIDLDLERKCRNIAARRKGAQCRTLFYRLLFTDHLNR